MFTISRGRLRTAAAWFASLALIVVSCVGVATSPAGAASSAKGKLQICTTNNQTKWIKFTISRSGYAKTQWLKSATHHKVCGSMLRMGHATYKVTQSSVSGTKLGSISISPKSRTYSNRPSSRIAKIRVKSSTTTHVTFANKAIPKKKAPAPAPKPKPTPAPTPTPAPSDPGSGFVEVCKVAGDSYVAGSVTVTVTAGSTSLSQVVPVGQCTGPLPVPAGNVTVSETAPFPTYLSNVTTSPAAALVATNLAGNSATVSVAASSDGSVETLVSLVNSTKLGQFKVCKTLSANSGDVISTGANAFYFDAAYQLAGSSSPTALSPIRVVVPALQQAACVLEPMALPLGTEVSVTEESAPATTLTGVTVQPASQDAGSSGRTADFIIGPNAGGITTASFTNMADGTIEICKRIDRDYNGLPFQFSVNGGAPITVKAGACSAPLSVPAGTATVQELATPNFSLVGFTATGPDGSSRIQGNDTDNPLTVAVPFGGVGNETLVTATNQVNTGQVKVCKTLDVNVPVGKSYTFTTVYTVGDRTYREDTTLTPTGIGPDGEVCSYLSHPLPIVQPDGSYVHFTTTEGGSPFGLDANGKPIVEPTAIEYAGNGAAGPSSSFQPGDPGSLDGTYYGSAQLGQGVNVITFTNSLVLDP